MDSIRVKTRAEHRADERPIEFELDGRSHRVQNVEAQWRTPEAEYFRVRAGTSTLFTLKHLISSDTWSVRSVESF